MRRLSLPLAIAAMTSFAAAMAPAVPMANETITYSYDARGRVVQVKHSGSVNNNVVANYSYDKADNRVTVNVTGAP